MTASESQIYHLSGTMTRPQKYGRFHLTRIVVVTVVFFLVRLRGISDRSERVPLLSFRGALVLFELYRRFQFPVGFLPVPLIVFGACKTAQVLPALCRREGQQSAATRRARSQNKGSRP